MKKISNLIRIGTCSWKYPSWKGIIYSEGVSGNKRERGQVLKYKF